MNVRPSLFAVVPLVVAACGGSLSTPGGSDAITGSERFGWDQPARDAGELATFRYAIYVDAARADAVDVSCAPTQVNGRFACTSSLPAMAAGSHTIEIAAVLTDAGATLESARSAAVRVVKR
jgi:hypothetical protein